MGTPFATVTGSVHTVLVSLGEICHLSSVDSDRQTQDKSSSIIAGCLHPFLSWELSEFLSRTRRKVPWGPQACARPRSQTLGFVGQAGSGNERNREGRVQSSWSAGRALPCLEGAPCSAPAVLMLEVNVRCIHQPRVSSMEGAHIRAAWWVLLCYMNISGSYVSSQFMCWYKYAPLTRLVPALPLAPCSPLTGMALSASQGLSRWHHGRPPPSTSRL